MNRHRGTGFIRASSNNRPIFCAAGGAGGSLVDSISGVSSICSISGTRYGIVNNTVTQFAVNQVPLEDDGLRGCPAFTQLAVTTETLNSWTKSNVSVTSAETYQGAALHAITENTTTGVHGIPYFAIAVSDNSIIGLSCVLGNRGRNFQAKAQIKSGYVALCKINTATGPLSDIHASVVAYSIRPIPNTSLFAFFIACNAGVGAANVRIYPELLNGATESYTGDGISGVHFAQPVFINYGVNGTPFIPPYVPNNTTGSISVVSEAATSTTGTSFALDDVKLARLKTALRGPNAQGHLELTFKSNIDSGWYTSSPQIIANIFCAGDLAARGLNIFRYDASTLVIRCVGAGASSPAEVIQAITPAQILKIVIDWGTHSTGQKMRITVNGVKSSLVSFSGSFGDKDLRFFFGNTVHAGWIVKGSLKIMDRPIW